ncbi:TetR/AcrR family transcriptional regulator [Pacificoceanicola onchidii]|uniref:TetR/AcrR family transcriptional regulator n=1 Tax=Pacificoceanicola onchidii TaxID=2562685 RepID=UPI0010A64FA5|nr:TetR/AcrR family transcriptional regulator [Pacificoceanicola onchidii]
MRDETDKESIKRQAVLQAAFGVFAQYGFARTSMSDIARAAGMSRPALYQYFGGKEDIARSLVAAFYGEATAAVTEALSGQGTVTELLQAAFRAKSGPGMEALLSSPHGEDMLEVSNNIAAAEAQEGRKTLVAAFAAWLEHMDRSGRIRLNDAPHALADSMIAALEGAKAGGRAPDYPTYLAHLDRMARLFGAALTA